MADTFAGRRKRSRRRAPYTFPDSVMNFASGTGRRPSNNQGDQSVFRPADPYAGQTGMRTGGAESSVMDAINLRSQMRQAGQSPFGVPYQSAPAFAPATPTPGLAEGGFFGPPVPTAIQPPPVNPFATYGGLNPDVDIRNAAQLFAGSVAGNPFITPEELARLQAGYAPLEQGINPAFYRYTSPVIQQALAGLRQSVGYRPEDAAFIARQFTPGSLY